jgi:hypothetical protein
MIDQKLCQELRDLIIRNFAMKHQLSNSEVKELLKQMPEVKEVILEEAQRLETLQGMEVKSPHPSFFSHPFFGV